MFLDKFLTTKTSTKSDSTFRSIVKTISWRLLGTIDTFMIAYFITKQTEVALTIGGIEVFTKMILYFIHERIWSKIKFI